MKLAYKKSCDSCGSEIFMAICRNGQWRAFETVEHPAGTAGVWAWRKREGMEETDIVPGHFMHYCAEYQDAKLRPDLSGWAS